MNEWPSKCGAQRDNKLVLGVPMYSVFLPSPPHLSAVPLPAGIPFLTGDLASHPHLGSPLYHLRDLTPRTAFPPASSVTLFVTFTSHKIHLFNLSHCYCFGLEPHHLPVWAISTVSSLNSSSDPVPRTQLLCLSFSALRPPHGLCS